MIKRSTDRKTANLATPNGKTAKIANAFGLPSGRQFSCPFATDVCNGVCYAGKLERVFKGMLNVMLANYEAIASADYGTVVSMLDTMITEFEAECDKWDADKLFRIHHDGDLFSLTYAQAWADVISMHPDVQFWLYTRSFDYVDPFRSLPNIAVYYSVDSDNLTHAIESYGRNPWVNLAALGRTFDDAKTLLSWFGERGTRCPELNGALPLISKDGGACKVCGLCVFGRGNVLFSSSKQ